MGVLTKKIYFGYCCVAAAFTCAAGGAGDAAFFDGVARRFAEEYTECTGDSRPAVDMREVLRWKRKMDAWTQSREYAELLRDYQKTGARAISPCKLIEWSKKRKDAQEAEETVLIRRLLDSAEDAEAASELTSLTASSFDFEGIPFGISKHAFIHFFKMKFGAPPAEKDRFLYMEALPLDGRPFLGAFFFNDKGLFYKYEIESDPLPADSLNRAVRPAAGHLAIFFRKRLGPPLHSERVGFFDIKTKELAVCDKWETAVNSLYIGFSVFDYQYYAKAVATDKGFASAGSATGHAD
jgi:hypothetical protein